jgi:hypothetical protein
VASDSRGLGLADEPILPKAAEDQLRAFLLDKKAGRALFHIKDGKILGFELTLVLNQEVLKSK